MSAHRNIVNYGRDNIGGPYTVVLIHRRGTGSAHALFQRGRGSYLRGDRASPLTIKQPKHDLPLKTPPRTMRPLPQRGQLRITQPKTHSRHATTMPPLAAKCNHEISPKKVTQNSHLRHPLARAPSHGGTEVLARP